MTPSLTILLSALLVTAPLGFFCYSPTTLVHIDVQPGTQNGVRILNTTLLAERGAEGVVYFEFRAIANGQFEEAAMFIRPFVVAEWFRAQDIIISDGLLMTTLQLGSAEYPLPNDARFAFRLMADSTTVLSEGTMTATSETVAGSEPWIIGSIALLASVLQILGVVVTRRHRSRLNSGKPETIKETGLASE